MKIVAQISGLFENMAAQGIDQYMTTPQCKRFCQKAKVVSIYAEAYYKAKAEPRDGLSELFAPSLPHDLLGQFLSSLYTQSSKSFPSIITNMMIDFLEWTTQFPFIDEIILDLQSLGADKEMITRIKKAYSLIESDLLRQAQLLKDITMSRATGGSADDNMYIRLRNSLMKNPVTASYMPVIVSKARNLNEFWTAIKTARSGYQPRREFLHQAFSYLFEKLEVRTQSPQVAITINQTYIHDIWKKALDRLSTDPEGAITIARTLVETVCRHIIETTGLAFDETMDLNKLYKTASKQLSLSPEQHTQPIFKQILSGCQSIVEGLGSLRNKYSDAHGKGPATIKPASRHAELAVNLSGSMCSFLLQTLDSKKDSS